MKVPDSISRMLDRAAALLADRRGHAVALLLFYLLLFEEYGRFVYIVYSFMGFDYYFDPVRVPVGMLLFATLMGFQFYLRTPNDRLYAMGMLVAVLYVIPNIVMFQLGKAAVYGSLYALLFHFMITCSGRFFPDMARLPKVSMRVQHWLLPVLVLLMMVPFFFAYGFSTDLSVFGLDEHSYDVRRALDDNETLLTLYFFSPLCKILIPLMIIYGLNNFRQRWWLTVVGVALMLYLFIANPQKTLLFSVAVIMVFWLFKDCHAKAGMLLYALLGVCAASVALNLIAGNLMAESILIRRIFFLPVEVSEAYFSFFNGHPICLSHSFLSRFFDYPYAQEPTFLIGYLMYNTDVANCNTGIIADGFMNFGHLGSLFFVAMAALVVRFIDATDYDSRFFGLSFLLLFTFLNGAFFTAMLTHGGILLMLVMMFLIPSRRQVRC